MPVHSAAAADRNLQVVLRGGQNGAEDGLAVVGLMITNQVRMIITGPPFSQPGAPPGLRTGGLRLSYTWELRRTSGKGKRKDAHVAVYSDKTVTQPVPPHQFVVYAPYLEFGTSRMAARPHLRPAVNTIRPLIPGIVVAGWNRGVRSAGLQG